MSLFSKISSIFQIQTKNKMEQQQQTRLNKLLKIIMCSQLQFNLRQSTLETINYLTENEKNIDYLFYYLNKQQFENNNDNNYFSLIQLLSVIHQLYYISDISHEISIKMRECHIKGLQYDDCENLKTEMEINNYQQYNFQTDYIINYEQNKNLNQFAYYYYVYLQRLAVNIELYKSVLKNQYPYQNNNENLDIKLMLLWLFKLQNLFNSAINMLKFEFLFIEIQKYIYQDLLQFQYFISVEIEKNIDHYITLSTNDTLSLYEIYLEQQKHYQILLSFQQLLQNKRLKLKEPHLCQINNQILQDFLNFISKLKVLNQFTFKKSIKVPNKTNPCMGIQTKNGNVIHLKSSSNQMEIIDSIDEIIETQENDKIKKKKIHIRGQSTFQVN